MFFSGDRKSKIFFSPKPKCFKVLVVDVCFSTWQDFQMTLTRKDFVKKNSPEKLTSYFFVPQALESQSIKWKQKWYPIL
jgi:hypothetical protein